MSGQDATPTVPPAPRDPQGITGVPAQPPRRRRHIARNVVLVILGLLLVGVLIIYGLWCAQPPYWRDNQEFLRTHDQAALMLAASRAEQRMLAVISDEDVIEQAPTPAPGAVRPGGPGVGAATPPGAGAGAGAGAGGADSGVRAIHLGLDELNAWLALRMPDWAMNQGIRIPPELSRFMVSTEDGLMVLACHVDTPRISQVVSLIVDMHLDADGQVHVQVTGLRAGRLRLPLSVLTSGLSGDPRLDQPEVQEVIAAVNGLTFDPVRRLDSKHRLRLVAFQVGPEGLDLSLRQESRRARTAPARR